MASGAKDNREIDFAAGILADLLQRHLPELVSALHLVGSAADGDFHAGRSDLDFVATLCHPLSVRDIEALIIVHRIYASDPTFPRFDCIWVTEADLAAGPDAAADGPATQQSQFFEQARGNRNPITWFSLRDNSRAVFGAVDRSLLWHDPVRLAAWTRENVESYWAPWLARHARLFTGPGLAMLGEAMPMWGVLGISRLHYTLKTGHIASKSAAGENALTAFDAHWRRIVEECLRIRRGRGHSLYTNPFRRRREALDFVAMAIAAIRAL